VGLFEPEPRQRVEWLLRPLFTSFQIVEFRAGTIFRGPASPYCEEHRREAEDGLRQLPGAFCFERFGDTTYLTYTLPGPQVKPLNRVLHVALFAATVLTTLLAGADLGFYPFLKALGLALAGRGEGLTVGGVFVYLVTHGAPFAVSILLILGVHESGHYFMARRYGMLVTPPFFLPAPIPPIGTFGAVIQIKSPMLHRRALLDVGLAGPLSGLVVALPILIYGMCHSTWVPIAEIRERVGVLFGNSVLTWGLERLLLGSPPPNMVFDWLSNPYAWAGWVGLLVTALNLMPVGQLDGGHIAYALLGRRQLRLAQFAFGVLLALGLSPFALRWEGWVLWCVLILLVLKMAHPPVVLGDLPIGPVRRALGWAALTLLLLIFVPIPAIALS